MDDPLVKGSYQRCNYFISYVCFEKKSFLAILANLICQLEYILKVSFDTGQLVIKKKISLFENSTILWLTPFCKEKFVHIG